MKEIISKNTTEKRIFPLVLLLWPLINVAQGFSLSDTTYSMTNYMFFMDMEGAWKYATYVSNLVGFVIINLCGGSMLWMNILTGLIISAIALGVYYMMRNEISSGILFISLICAESLCWCPSVILYNYLTYMCLTFAAILIYKATVNNNKKMYFIAGLILGISFFVRISNVIQIILILSVWLGIILYRAPGKKAKIIKPTLICIGGYLAGLVAILVIIILISGFGGIIEAFNWATGLFSSNEDAGGYSGTEMVKTIVLNYIPHIKWLFIMVAATIAGIAGFMTLKDKLILLKKIGYTVCVLVLFFYFNRNGVFNLYYRNTGAIWSISVILILCQYVVLFYTAIYKNADKKDKLLAFIAITILLITPIGSNNHLFTVINNMFFTLPVSVAMFVKLISPYSKEAIMYPVKCMMGVFFIVFFVQASLFHIEYSFKCGENGEARDSKVEGGNVLKGMYGTKEDTELIQEITMLCRTIPLANADGLILYGNIPGVSYVLRKGPSISTSWPDLDSYSIDTLEDDLNKADNSIVIIKNDAFINAKEDKKLAKILEYSEKYENIYDGKYIRVYY